MANPSQQAVTYLGLRRECGFGDRDFSCLFRTLKHLLSDVKNIVGLEGRSKHGELYDRWLTELVNTAFSEIYFGASCNRIWLHGRDHAKIYNFASRVVELAASIIRDSIVAQTKIDPEANRTVSMENIPAYDPNAQRNGIAQGYAPPAHPGLAASVGSSRNPSTYFQASGLGGYTLAGTAHEKSDSRNGGGPLHAMPPGGITPVVIHPAQTSRAGGPLVLPPGGITPVVIHPAQTSRAGGPLVLPPGGITPVVIHPAQTSPAGGPLEQKNTNQTVLKRGQTIAKRPALEAPKLPATKRRQTRGATPIQRAAAIATENAKTLERIMVKPPPNTQKPVVVAAPKDTVPASAASATLGANPIKPDVDTPDNPTPEPSPANWPPAVPTPSAAKPGIETKPLLAADGSVASHESAPSRFKIFKTRLSTSSKIHFVYSEDTPTMKSFLDLVRNRWKLGEKQDIKGVEMLIKDRVFVLNLRKEMDWDIALELAIEGGWRVDMVVEVGEVD